jgi:O-antigen/teichoic acid export membrane protein
MLVSSSLKARTLTAGAWATILGLAGTGIRFVNSLIITRLLVPEVFGVVALATAFTTVVSLLSDIGLKQYVIFNERSKEREVLDTIWTLSVFRGVIIAAVSMLLAATVYLAAESSLFRDESVYAHPDLPLVLAHFGVSAIILGFKSPKMAMLERDLQLKTYGTVDLVAHLASTAATLLLAWYWRSVWAIVGGNYVLSLALVLLSLFWVKGPMGRLIWNREIALQIFHYGKWILMASTAYVLASNADRLVLGNLLSPANLGLYMIALNVLQMFEQTVSKPFTAVALPALSEVARRGASHMRQRYLKLRLPYDIATITLSGAIFAAGQLIVELLYDPRYASAGHVLQVLSFSLLFPRYSAIGIAHTALGQPQTEAWVSFAKLISIALCIPVAHLIGGYEGTLWAIAFHMVPGAIIYLYRNQRYGLNHFGFELGVLAFWPIGYGLGLVGMTVLRWLLPT